MKTTTDTEPASFPGGGFGYLLNETRNVLLSSMEKELEPLHITAAQFIIIVGIAHHRANTSTGLSQLLGYDSGAMTRLLDRIERKDFIKRIRNMEDRRTINIELTPKGRELYPQIMEALDRVQAKLLSGFTRSEAEQFQLFLQRAATNAGQLK